MSWIVKVGKQGKKIVKKLITPAEKHYVGYTRRIERVHTTRRICAMTFDDGPMGLPASPDRFDGRTLTDVLLDTLAQYGARGSFDVIGDTSANYPDEAGKLGSAAWGGVRFDHYPDIHCDEQGGAEHNDRLIRRMLAEGHQITNHGYRHIIFGKKPFVYGAREYLPGFDAAVEDLTRLHTLMQTRYGYTMTLARPPHYVDKMTGGFTSYDVYDHMGYQYMAASFDGAGWLPSTESDPEAALQAEIRAMVEPMRKALEKDPDFFCGQIIFQKDGYNMAKRTPVAFALGEQLALLQEYGYQVVPVGELLAESPFADVGRDEPLFDRLTALAQQRAIVFSDNRLRLDDPMTVGELAMLLAPKAEAITRRVAQLRQTGRAGAYDGAMAWCRAGREHAVDAVGDHAAVRRADDGLKRVADELRRVMDDVRILIHHLVAGAVDAAVDRIEILAQKVRRDVLGLAVEAGGDGLVIRLGDLHRRVRQLQHERRVHDVAVADRVLEQGAVQARQRHAVALHDRVEQVEVQLRHDVKALVAGLVLIGADHAHRVPLRAQEADEVHAGDRGTIVFFAQNITDNRDRHVVVSFLVF